ncbi:hypothetical protein BFJ66_g17001 [Fusarium oxysporum f. sp. cepae]|uniref:Dienelactone hydrolase domain-containing protein n=1 Tax=Fusarium oxysporum f. sp. cepae TaxID=396571 RepID=A0A3L6MS29_FUSOX|nr:hypothetical protein BFJ65_g18151 [Fusarium oxysporum f. sp. cepae]RKK26391.1 hypothetical protein BFJ67_g16683 [Fusarium oxysporum f. sp. cepae]RKK26691.1 hypothetical protein BFJ66_g17001 [Fusarium oxysporum f. sp. cepae]
MSIPSFTNLIRFLDEDSVEAYGEVAPESLDNIEGSVVKVMGQDIEYLRDTGKTAVVKKASDALAGPYDDITIPKEAHLMDYEGELCIIIGKDGKDIQPQDALDYILGYTVGNDLSSRYWQRPPRAGGQFCYAKSFDGFAPIGPTILSPHVATAESLHLTTKVNGEVRQLSPISDMIFNVRDIISHCSQGTTLPWERPPPPRAPEPSHNSIVQWLANRLSLDVGGYEPNGSVKTIHGLNVYQALAPAEVKGEILFLPDVFGLATHNKILADQYANFGYNTTIVDYFQGEALPDIIMSYTPGTDVDSYSNFSPEEKEIIRNADISTWLSRHSRAKVSGLLHPFFVAFREGLGQSAKLHVLGHCFGGKYALRLAKSNKITSEMTMHPSFIEEDDWQNLQRPVMVCCAESDVFTPSLIADTFKAATEWKVYYKISVYGGTVHGFASRADRSNSEQMRPYRSSFEDSLSWIKLVEGS